MTAPSIDDLLQRHRARIDRVAFAYGRGPADREEIAQEVRVQLWRSLPRLLPHLAESSWVYRIALNVAIAHVRGERRRERTLADADVGALPAASTPEPSADLERLRACLDEFSPFDRALLLLWLDGEEHAAIAAVLGLTATNVGTKLHRLRQRLRDAYDRASRRNPDPDHGTH